jgi:HEAT repeat protein
MKIQYTLRGSFVSALSLAALLAGSSVALAGKGGSAGQIRSAISAGSVDSIVAELERTEGLVCTECVDIVTALTDHNSYAVREAAGWWFAKRPSLATMMISQMVDDLTLQTDARKVRNAADFLGAVRAFSSVDVLSATMQKSGVDAPARLAIVRALGSLAKKSVNPALSLAMKDADASVRKQALIAWRDIREQSNAEPAVALLSDTDADVRGEAAALMGTFAQASGRATLESLVVSDADPVVRRNAAWALGRIGNRASRPALEAASKDKSGLVSGVAKAAISSLK